MVDTSPPSAAEDLVPLGYDRLVRIDVAGVVQIIDVEFFRVRVPGLLVPVGLRSLARIDGIGAGGCDARNLEPSGLPLWAHGPFLEQARRVRVRSLRGNRLYGQIGRRRLREDPAD